MREQLTIIYILALCFCSCKERNPIVVMQLDGVNFVECNIDRITDLRTINLSEIAEYSEIVLLSDETFNTNDYPEIRRIFVSEKYILIQPEGITSPLLYNRDGFFIKELVYKDNKSPVILAEFDDEEDKIYLMMAGFVFLIYDVADEDFEQVALTYHDDFDFLVLDNNRIISTFRNHKEIWAYEQSLNSTTPFYIKSRVRNKLLNYASGTPRFLKSGDNIIFSFYQANDTSYYFNSKTKNLTPFLRCYSPSHTVRYDPNIDGDMDYLSAINREQYKKSPSYARRMLALGDRFILFQDYVNNCTRYYIINREKPEAFFIEQIINDFQGNLPVKFQENFSSWHYVSNKDNYLVCCFKVDEIQRHKEKMFSFIDWESSDSLSCLNLTEESNEIESDRNVLLISKLRL